jgi:exonuclease III
LKTAELQNTNIDHYSIGGQFYRTIHAQGGVVVYIHNNLYSTAINLSKYCIEKDIEICAVRLEVQYSVFCIITIYRSPSGNFKSFLETLDAVLQSVYSPSQEIIICGDININYLVVNEQRKQLDNLLLLYNLTGIVDFPTRLTDTSTAIDNVFIDVDRFHNYVVTPFPNGLIMMRREWFLRHCIQDGLQLQNL